MSVHSITNQAVSQSVNQSTPVSLGTHLELLKSKGKHRNRNRKSSMEGGREKRKEGPWTGQRQKSFMRSVPLEPKRGSAVSSLNQSFNCSFPDGKERGRKSVIDGKYLRSTSLAAPSTSYQHGPNHRTLPR